MKRVFKVSVVLLVILAVLVGGAVLILRNSQPAASPVFLPDGTVVRFLGTTVGTNHVYGSKFWKVINRLPGPLARPILKFMGKPPFPNSVNTSRTNLVVWLEHSGALPTGSVAQRAFLRVPGGRLSGPEQYVSFFWRGAPTNEEPRSVALVSFNSPRGTNESWFLYDVDLSDASGNQLAAKSRSGMTDSIVFSPVLWPGEPAWKVKLHLKRKTGFSSNELLTFSNVSIPAIGTTNQLDLTNSIMGIQTVFKQLVQRPPMTNHSYSSRDLSQFRVEHDELDGTNQIDLVSITVHPMGTNMTTSGSSWTEEYHEYNLMFVPTNATHMDFVFSVQKARFVEFMVAPNWITNDYVLKE